MVTEETCLLPVEETTAVKRDATTLPQQPDKYLFNDHYSSKHHHFPNEDTTECVVKQATSDVVSLVSQGYDRSAAPVSYQASHQQTSVPNQQVASPQVSYAAVVEKCDNGISQPQYSQAPLVSQVTNTVSQPQFYQVQPSASLSAAAPAASYGHVVHPSMSQPHITISQHQPQQSIVVSSQAPPPPPLSPPYARTSLRPSPPSTSLPIASMASIPPPPPPPVEDQNRTLPPYFASQVPPPPPPPMYNANPHMTHPNYNPPYNIGQAPPPPPPPSHYGPPSGPYW